MFRRRGKTVQAAAEDATDATPDAPSQEAADASADTSPAGEQSSTAEQPSKPDRPHGPWDVSELDDRPSHTAARLDLGGVRIRPVAGMKVQMQVDKNSGQATSVMLVSDQGALQLMVIAAPKSKPLWPQTMRALRSDADRRGGSAQDGKGPWGPVLRMALPAATPDGKQGVQPSVVLGIDGPRWLLRATLIGRAAVDQEQMNRMMAIVQDTVVVRGDQPMAPGEVIALTPPPRPAADGDDPSTRPDSVGEASVAPDDASDEAHLTDEAGDPQTT
jgi:hypothetical protein